MSSNTRIEEVLSGIAGHYDLVYFSVQIPLYEGWNLVRCPLSETRLITEALSSIEGKYDLVYAYDASDTADPWKKYNVAAPSLLNDLTEMRPRYGHWIRVSDDCTGPAQGR